MQWSFNYLIHKLILLSLFTGTSHILAIPVMAHKTVPRMCLTNVTLSSYPEPCTSTCEPVLYIQKRCQDMIPCMCQHVKPLAMSDCVQCMKDAAGDLLRVPGYLNATVLEVSAYTSVCSSISEGDEIKQSVIELECGSTEMQVDSIPAHIPFHNSHPYDQAETLPWLHSLFPMFSIIVACIFVLFYK